MSGIRDVVRVDARTGEPMTAGDVTVTPHSKALIVQWPGGGAVWNRPIAVDVERNGQTEHVRIADVTRAAQIGVVVVSALVVLMMLVISLKKRRIPHEDETG